MSEVHYAGSHRPYRPSNGTEGDIFQAAWCAKCARANYDDPDNACMIELRALAHGITDPEYPVEWQYSNGGGPQCTAFAADEPPEPRCDKTIDMFACTKAEDRDVLMGCAASLAAAISLLERGGKSAAPSDKMFNLMLDDYRASLERARDVLRNES